MFKCIPLISALSSHNRMIIPGKYECDRYMALIRPFQQKTIFQTLKFIFRKKKSFIFQISCFENDRLGEILMEHKITFVFSSGFSLIASLELHPNLSDPLCL